MIEEQSLVDSKYAWNGTRDILNLIVPYCYNYEVCGGLRRGNDTVHDVDIVIWPADYFAISSKLGAEYKMVASPHKYLIDAEGFKTEIWIANSLEEYEVLKLVKTGSAGFNLQLAMNAHDKNMALKYKDGLFGLYSAIKGWDKERNKFKYYYNPLRRLWYSEHDIIMNVFEDEKYLDPHNRNIAFDPTTKWIEDA